MPGNKKRKRKPGGRKVVKKDGDTDQPGGAPNAKGARSFAKTFGAPKGSRSPISPASNRGSARGR